MGCLFRFTYSFFVLVPFQIVPARIGNSDDGEFGGGHHLHTFMEFFGRLSKKSDTGFFRSDGRSERGRIPCDSIYGGNRKWGNDWKGFYGRHSENV